jgi:hypothetical protein
MKPMKMWHPPATKTVQEAESDPTVQNQISGRIPNTKHNGALALPKLNRRPSTTASSISLKENLNRKQHRASRRRSISCSSDARFAKNADTPGGEVSAYGRIGVSAF